MGFIEAWWGLLWVQSQALRSVGQASTCSIACDVCQSEFVSNLAMECVPGFVVHRAFDAVAQLPTMRENISDA